MKRTAFFALIAALAASCATAPAAEDVALRVSWLDGNRVTQGIPTGVDAIEIVLFDAAHPMGDPVTFSVAGLMDRDGNMSPEAVRKELPVGQTFSLTVYGSTGGTRTHIGHSGPLFLQSGERRYIAMQLVAIGTSQRLDGAGFPARFLHTTTSLPDGRVLIAGGFDRLTAVATCPAGTVAGAKCYEAQAVSDASVYDPATGRFWPIRGGMRQARGGHTATALPGGRVLVAGGTSRAVLVALPQGMPTPSAFVPTFLDRGVADTDTRSVATFEIFDPQLNAEETDLDSDGDPGRGAFVGRADDPSQPGVLNLARAFHGAALVPGTSRVLIAGGLGGPGAETSYEVFDDRRPGGYGVVPASGSNVLGARRVFPSVVGVGTGASASVWILGGGRATDNATLADVWKPVTMPMPNPNGAIVAASMDSSFPAPAAGMTVTAPQYSLYGAYAAPIAQGASALVTGWLGPLCTIGMTTPVFDPGDASVEYCRPNTGAERTFTLTASTGAAVATPTMSPQSFAAGAVLDDGSVIVTGGLTSLLLIAGTTVNLYTGRVTAGAADRANVSIALSDARAMHGAAALPDRGVLVTGGVRFTNLGASVTVLNTAEVLYLSR